LVRTEDSRRVASYHLIDIVLRYSGDTSVGHDSRKDHASIPQRQIGTSMLIWKVHAEHRRIGRNNHPVGIPQLAHSGYGRNPGSVGCLGLKAEAVHPKHGSPVCQATQVVNIITVTTMPNDYAAQVDAAGLEIVLLPQAGSILSIRVGKDGYTGLKVCIRYGLHDVHDTVCHTVLVCGTLQYRGAYSCLADALANVSDKQVGQRIRAAQGPTRTAEFS